MLTYLGLTTDEWPHPGALQHEWGRARGSVEILIIVLFGIPCYVLLGCICEAIQKLAR